VPDAGNGCLSDLLEAEPKQKVSCAICQALLVKPPPITGPNQVWGVEITYNRMEKGFMYLLVILDWYSRNIIDFELSSTLEKTFVLNCLKRAFRTATPEIINSDQGGHVRQEVA